MKGTVYLKNKPKNDLLMLEKHKMDHSFSKLIFWKTASPTFWRYRGSMPGGNKDDLRKFKEKIKVCVLLLFNIRNYGL